MANGHGGSRPGAGRKKKALSEKLIDGNPGKAPLTKLQFDLKDTDIRLYRAANGHSHESDFIDGIYEKRAIATDCEIGHRSISACHIANICERLRLDSLAWDPAKEMFTGAHAARANALLEVPHFNGWRL